MSKFADLASSSLDRFHRALSAFVTKVGATPVSPPGLTREALDDLLRITDRAGKASGAIGHSLKLIDLTSLDIVDMQVRLQGETARLASSLRELGQAVERQHFVRESFEDELVGLHDASQMLASAIFPSAVEGLRDVNTRLWDFEKIEWKRYTDLLTRVVQRNSITPAQQAAIESIADSVANAFAEVNTLLNDLAESRSVDAVDLRRRLDRAPLNLMTALETARTRLIDGPKALDVFKPVITASTKVAEDVAKLLRKLTIPVFPAHDRLGECCDYISSEMYESLSGVQAFALLNILARLQQIEIAGAPLLVNRHATVFAVFADRIYLEADRSLIDDIRAADGTFQAAPASLHKFREGSFKQKTHRKGNLQVCFATRPGNRVAIDADIDLYPTPVRHLFGEVLVNHLTGSTTSQYAVLEILNTQQVALIGGFALLPTGNFNV